jgi:hypothetical protein
MGRVWGIGEPAFLVGYLALAVLVLAVAMLMRQAIVRRGAKSARQLDGKNPDDLYLIAVLSDEEDRGWRLRSAACGALAVRGLMYYGEDGLPYRASGPTPAKLSTAELEALDGRGLYHDTHTAPTPGPVLALLGALRERLAAGGADPPVLLERDGRYPPARELHAELDAIAEAADLPTPTQPRATDTKACLSSAQHDPGPTCE